AEIERALDEPIHSEALSSIVKQEHKVAIVVDDATRPAPSDLMVPPILEELIMAGVREENIRVVFGCGTHRAVTREEALRLLGEEVLNRVKVTSHDCKAQDLVYIGKTKKHGTKVHLNRVFAEADIKILTGDICFHYYAGYGGGRKSVLPAVSGEETIRHNHVMLLHPKAKTGVLEGNPVHEDMVEAAKLAKVDFVVNVVVNGKGEIVKAFAGDLEKVFYEGTKLVDEMCRVQVNRKADIVVVSPGGHPADLNLFQAYKGVDNTLEVVKRGGVVILVAECPEGYGNQIFYDWMVKFKDLKAVERSIKRNFVLGGHKAYYLMKALRKVQIILVSSMPDFYAVNVFKLKTARAVNDALNEAFSIAGKKAKVWAMPNGNATLPEFKREED
ncbi:nickel-dependent lactate racemase, partial [Candidatus Bathyarchaeota archaeon]|nr:nickel-dependent lactate racemase [Candidatus Bathyarchaeota archaeon]